MTEGPKPVRRIVTIDDAGGKSVAIEDGPVGGVRTDPARPGFVSTRVWVTDATPVRIKHAREALARPHRIEPPPHGSVCRIVTFPPDAAFRNKVGGAEVAAFFRAIGSPAASTYSPKTPHPYMQKTRTLDSIYGECYREACPHILGYKKLGQEAVFAFQFGGDTTSRLPPQGDWRCLDLARASEVRLRDGRWHSGTRHTKTQTCIQFVDVDVNVPDTLTRRQLLAFGSPHLRPPRRAGE